MSKTDDAFREFLTATVKPPRRAKLAVVVAAELAEDIFTRGLEPGDALPNEAEMLQGLDVSRATLREALRVLETQGVITMRTGRGGGPEVAQPNPRALAETLTVNFRALHVTFEEILFTRATIEPALAHHAALNHTQEDLDRLRACADAVARTAWDAPEILQLNRDFHTAVALASHNRPLAVLWSAISAVADGQGLGVDEAQWAVGKAAHRRIVAAIAKRDGRAAERAMSKHVSAYHQDVSADYPTFLSTPVSIPRTQ